MTHSPKLVGYSVLQLSTVNEAWKSAKF